MYGDPRVTSLTLFRGLMQAQQEPLRSLLVEDPSTRVARGHTSVDVVPQQAHLLVGRDLTVERSLVVGGWSLDFANGQFHVSDQASPLVSLKDVKPKKKSDFDG